MINLNTTQSVKKTSTALGEKCDSTKKNMKKLMLTAGVAESKTVKTMIPRIPGSDDDVVFVGLNGVKFYFRRGESIEMPEQILEILQNTGNI